MQVTPPQPALPTLAQPGPVVLVPVISGNVATLPIGALLQATVTRVTPGEAVLNVNGQPVTVRPGAAGLQAGAAILVRVPNATANPGASPMLEIVGRPPPPAPEGPGRAATATVGQTAEVTAPAVAPQRQPVGQAAPPARAPQVMLVDILAVLPDGRLRVQFDGREDVAASPERLAAGGRYVLQVERTPSGLAVRRPPDSPDLPAAVAAAVLRSSRPPDLGASLKPLLAELAALPLAPTRTGPTPTPTKEAPTTPMQQAATAVRDAVRSFVPGETRPPNPAELQSLVENGGLHFEAKLARLLEGERAGAPQAVARPPAAGGQSDRGEAPGAARAPQAPAADLKEGLLRLLQTAQDLGSAAQFPAARAALDGIESQQAANVLAQVQGTPYVLQVPFPDGEGWRTLHLAVEPEQDGRPDSGAQTGTGSFRMLMHVPLADLGETWIDAGLSGDRLRAVLYLGGPAVRDRVRSEFPALHDELRAGGFGEVLLDVRPVGDLPQRRRAQGAALRAGRTGPESVLDVTA